MCVQRTEKSISGLNPCFSGGWSRSEIEDAQHRSTTVGLNPCFSGGWSRRSVTVTEWP